jgi:hypothetical protein
VLSQLTTVWHAMVDERRSLLDEVGALLKVIDLR